jgi:hypothetical protein
MGMMRHCDIYDHAGPVTIAFTNKTADEEDATSEIRLEDSLEAKYAGGAYVPRPACVGRSASASDAQGQHLVSAFTVNKSSSPQDSLRSLLKTF